MYFRPLKPTYFLQDLECKRLLKQFCGILEGVGHRDVGSHWSEEVLSNLIQCCSASSRSTMTDVCHLSSVLTWIRDWCVGQGKPVPGPFKRFLRAIARDYPIIGLLRYKSVLGSAADLTPLMTAMKANLTTDMESLSVL